jgi:mRNA-degrading endonuclease RelE of RelBE toxin-antitoxin system
MTYKVIRDVVADAEIQEFGRYAADYSEDFAREQFTRLNNIFNVDLAESPNTWSAFYITGLPNRGYLLRVGRRTSYWIVYTVDEDAKIVKVLRFCNASKEPAAFEL